MNMNSHKLEKGPLKDADVMAFAVVRDVAAARAFYERTLGLTILADDPQALVLSSGGTVIRLQKGANHQPAQYTVLGWRVSDIRAAATRLRDAGVRLERYEWMTFQEDSGIATFPNGDAVAWFKDPDGNILSIAQLK
jgi:catechol 2,3-dioxygenase-like lactoylglutathione lyase family enzyme